MGLAMLVLLVALTAGVVSVVWLAWVARSVSRAARGIRGFSPSALLVGEGGEAGLAIDERRCKVCFMRRSAHGIESRVMPFSQLVCAKVMRDGLTEARTLEASELARSGGHRVLSAGAGVSAGVSESGVTKEARERIVLRVVVRDTQRPTHDVILLSARRVRSKERISTALKARLWSRNIALAIGYAQSQQSRSGPPAPFLLPREIIHPPAGWFRESRRLGGRPQKRGDEVPDRE
jgi:hypothetical protein